MATQLSIVNKVLRRLRENEVSTVALTDYSVLMADFLNDIVGEMQDDYDWSQLNHETSFDVVVDQIEYDLSATVSGGGDMDNATTRLPNNRSQIRYLDGSPMTWMFDDDSDTNGFLMTLNHQDWLYSQQKSNSASQVDSPKDYSLVPQNDADGFTFNLWPKPGQTRVIKQRWWTPTADLEVDGTDDNTVVYLPERVIVLGMLFLAANERGEEMGEPGGILAARYDKAKAEAIATDMRNRAATNEYEAYRD